MQEEIVDILMATYNPKINFLKMQLDSLLNQTYKNINIIISDDNSPDIHVLEVLKEYAKNDSRIVLFLNNTNKGYIKNFEFLLEKSNADYIMFCDHDDIWHKNKVERSLHKLINSDVDLVYVNARQIDENNNVINSNYLKYKNLPLIKGKNSILPFSRHIAIGCSQIFTKSIKEKILPFKESVMAHDWINTYVANCQKGIDYINEPLIDYRLHASNVFGGRSLKQNIKKWKSKNGRSYKSYINYRDDAIYRAYLSGSVMCNEYIYRTENENVIKYYKKIRKNKFINLRIDKYFKYLGFEGIGKRAIKEILIFHFPIIAYVAFILN